MIDTKKKKKIFFICLGILLIIIILIYLRINKTTYAYQDNNYMGEYVLNPEWIKYTSKSDYEKGKYEVIPDKFIYKYNKENKINLLSEEVSYPSYYNLNDFGYSTYPDHQGSLGICWAYAAASSMESYLLRNGVSNINNPIKFSTRQFDYASVHKDNITEGFNPYYVVGRNYIGSGARFNTAFVLMASGISPVTSNIFADTTDVSKKSIGEIINLDNVEYVVDSYVNYGVIGDYTSDEARENWVNEIKYHLLNYGSVAIAIKGSSVYSAGSCIHVNADKSNFLVNQNGECNETGSTGHAMAIIGYDDNYSYEYCRLDSTTTNDLSNCDNIVSGKGAFILKNSWGESYPYPYLAYTSNVDGSYGVTGVSLKNWDNNYDMTKENDSSYKYKLSSVTYYKSENFTERLKKISFYSNTSDVTDYEIYVSVNGDDNYEYVDTVISDKVGLNSLVIDKDILLNKNKFSIKITSLNGYVSNIYVFTLDDYSSNDIKIDTVMKGNNEYEFNASELSFYSVTKNIPNGSLISYKLLDSNGKDVTDILDITNNYNLNYHVKPNVKVTSTLPSGILTLNTFYDGVLLDSDTVVISSLENLWSGGRGTVDDPYLIKDVDDFKKIFTSEEYLGVSYKLINNLDFSEVSDWNAGLISNYQSFSGTFDGDNHIIMGLSASSNIPSIFYSLNNAVVKNIIFSESTFDFKESGWGNLVSIMAYDSTLENIVVTKTVKISGDASYAGGLVGTAYNTDFIHIASYALIDTSYEYNGKASGIVNEGYGIYINECYNYGNITVGKSIAGGLVGVLKSNNTRDSLVKNSYNYGNIISSVTGGGIVGDGENSVIENVYNIFSSKPNSNIGNIIGSSYHMGLKNNFYDERYGSTLVTDRGNSTTMINVMGKGNDDLKREDVYLNFDFDNVWKMSDDYPIFMNFNYTYLSSIDVYDEFRLEVGDEKEIILSFSPLSASNNSVCYELLNNGVAKIDGNVITALRKGNTILKIVSLDGSHIIKEVLIEVTLDSINLDDYEVIDDSYIKVFENYSIDSLRDSIYTGDKYRIEISSKNPFVGTGDKVSIFSNDILANEYITVVMGDVTGNGKIDLGDVAKLYQYVNGGFDMNKEFKFSAGVSGNANLGLDDVNKLYKYVRKDIGILE